MAATNYTPIQLYYSTTPAVAPVAGNLAYGELAINVADGKLYYKDSGNIVQILATQGTSVIGGSTTQIQYNNAGVLAGNAGMTFNSGTSTTTLTTLNLTNALGAIYGGTGQSAYTQGDVLYASATNTLAKLGIGTVNYILTSTGSVPQWSAPGSITISTATNLAGGLAGSVPYQSGAGATTFLTIGSVNQIMTSTGSAPQWVSSISPASGGTGVANNAASTLTISGSFSTTLTVSATTALTLPTSGTVTTNGGVVTLTNKRIDPRVSTAVSAASIAPDVASFDQYCLTAQAVALAVNASTGIPVNGTKLLFRFLDNGTARAITWDATYVAIGVTLPTTTVINKTTYVGCIYNTNNTRWDVIAVTTQA